MTFNRHLLKNFIFRGIYYSSIFVLNIFIARTFQAELGGWINYITNNFSLLLLLGSFSLEISVLYYGTSKKISQPKLATFALIWSLLVCVCFYFVIHSFITYDNSIQSKKLIQFASLNYIAGIIITNFFFNLFIILEEFAIPNILLSILNLFLIISIPENIFGFHIFNKDTFIYYYYFSFTLQGVLLILAYYIHQKKIHLQLVNIKDFLLLFKYALTCFMGNLIFFLSYRIDYWFINFYRKNPSELGNYIQASKMGQMLLMFAVILGSSIFPVTASGEDRQALLKKILTIVRNFVFLFIGLIVFSLLIGDGIMTSVFGPTFNLMYWPFILLLPGILSLSISTILSAYFGGMNKIMINVKSALIGLIVISLLDFFFIKKYGINGAAIISSIGYTCTMLYGLYYFRKDFPFNLSDLFSFQKKISRTN